jgi:hypothetical protein
MPQPELSSERPKPVPTVFVPLVALFNFNYPFIIRVACKAGHAIARHLILEINIGHGWPIVVGVEVQLCEDMAQFESSSRRDILQRLVFVIETIVGGVDN